MRLSCSCTYPATSYEIRWDRTNYEAICEMSSCLCRSCPFIPIIPFGTPFSRTAEALSFLLKLCCTRKSNLQIR
jgi:hypothetical protein